MSQPVEAEVPEGRPTSRSIVSRLVFLVVVVAAVALGGRYGSAIWRIFLDYRETTRGAEDSVPVGYVGVHLRKSYNDRPAQFLREEEGRKLLWTRKGDDGLPKFVDVTQAAFRVDALSGGFGNDSIPGIDYPVFEKADSERGQRLRGNQPVHGLVAKDGPRAYPSELLRKIEVVNEQDGATPLVIVFDRRRAIATFHDRRIDGKPVTFGTTGYAFGDTPDPAIGSPLLYDRKTGSLWLPEADALVCVNGPLHGAKLPALRGLATEMPWSSWRGAHPNTTVLMGSDREKPIPTE